MASPRIIMRCLNEFCTNFSRGRDYVETMGSRWCKAFESTPDNALINAIQDICETTFKYPPTLGDVVGSVKKQVADMLGHVGAGVGVKRFSFCSECKDRKGIVETAAHYIWIAESCNETGKKEGKYYVSVKDNVCGCPDSVAYRGKDLRGWSERRKKLREDPRLELITWKGMEAFFFTTSEQPYLKGVGWSGDYYDWTMDLNEFESMQERIQARRRGDLPSTGYSRAVDIMMSGNTAAISALMSGDGRSLPVESVEVDQYVTKDDLDWE